MNKIFALSTLVSIVALTSSISAFAECRQANLQSADQSKISIDYSSHNMTDGDSAWMVPAIHVYLSAEKCSAQTVVVQLVRSQFGFSSSIPQTLTKDSQNPCEFSATANNVELANHGGTLQQSIAVQLIYPQGSNPATEWLEDPVTHGHNFGYAFMTEGYAPTLEVCL